MQVIVPTESDIFIYKYHNPQFTGKIQASDNRENEYYYIVLKNGKYHNSYGSAIFGMASNELGGNYYLEGVYLCYKG